MEKYTVIKAFSVLEKALLIPEDEVYAELAISRYSVFNAKTRKFIGNVNAEKFEKVTKKTKEFKIYDNSIAKAKLFHLLVAMKAKTRSKNHKDDYNLLIEEIEKTF